MMAGGNSGPLFLFCAVYTQKMTALTPRLDPFDETTLLYTHPRIVREFYTQKRNYVKEFDLFCPGVDDRIDRIM